MKIFCILNNVDEKKAIEYLGKAREIIQSKLNLDFNWYFEFIDEPIEFTNFWAGKMLKEYHTNRWNTNAIGCHSILYFYNTTEQGVFNVSYIKEGRPQSQVVLQNHSLTPEIIAHELTHNIFLNLREKGIYLTDELDKGGVEDRLQLLKDNLKKFIGFERIISEPLPIDGKIDKLEKIKEALQSFVNYIQGLRPLKDLGIAMSQMEGYPIFGSRAYRNNNPLNIRYIGQSLAIGGDNDNFAIFRTPEDGWEACFNDLKLKITGKSSTGLNGESTIEQLIRTWSETDQEEYLKYVCDKLKIQKDFKIKNFLI